MLGFVQGATEYAPVSSSGHLILVPWLFGWEQLGGNADFAKTFDVALHMGETFRQRTIADDSRRRLA